MKICDKCGKGNKEQNVIFTYINPDNEELEKVRVSAVQCKKCGQKYLKSEFKKAKE